MVKFLVWLGSWFPNIGQTVELLLASVFSRVECGIALSALEFLRTKETMHDKHLALSLTLAVTR